jgi:hypothetical protein
MATKLDPIIFGESKNIDFKKFNIGALTKAVTYSLEEFGKKGVQGLAIKSKEVNALLEYEEKAKRAKEPYIQAGVAKKDLVLVVRDKKNDKFEAMTVVVKDYTDIRDQLANNNAAVVNIEPNKADTVIPGAAKAQADRFGAAVQAEADADFGGITGNVVLCAHGAPKVLPGRVIGVELGELTPAGIIELLIGNKDKAKRIGKDYDGTVTLSGCFTASGGPEADRQDDPFAKKVLDSLRSKGYSKVSVVGMPGPSWTSRADTKTDSHGTTVKTGEKAVFPAMSDYSTGVNALRKKIDTLTDGLLAAAKKSPDPKNFMATPGAKNVIQQIDKLEKEMKEVAARLNKQGTGESIAGLKGTFGLRQIQAQVPGAV